GGPLVSFIKVGDKRFEPDAPRVTVTEPGPLRVRIELRGHYSEAFDYIVRLDAFANQPFVRVLHTFEQHAAEPYTNLQQLAVAVPLVLAGPAAYRAGVEKGAPLAGSLPPNGFTLFQEDNEVLHAAQARREQHAAGWVDLSDATHGVAVAARYFWQEYPQ